MLIGAGRVARLARDNGSAAMASASVLWELACFATSLLQARLQLVRLKQGAEPSIRLSDFETPQGFYSSGCCSHAAIWSQGSRPRFAREE
jgi:hypothetical protein